MHSLRARVFNAILIVAALSACTTSSNATRVRRDGSQNVLLITIDTLRTDAVGAYGNRRTPWMDLAAGGVRFTAARVHRRDPAVAREHPVGRVPVSSRRS